MNGALQSWWWLKWPELQSQFHHQQTKQNLTAQHIYHRRSHPLLPPAPSWLATSAYPDKITITTNQTTLH